MSCSVTQDQSLETERASEHVVGDALASGEVVGVQPHRMMHAEARVIPAEHLRDERVVDLAALQQQVEDLPLPDLSKGSRSSADRFPKREPAVSRRIDNQKSRTLLSIKGHAWAVHSG